MTPKEKAIELINKYHSLELIELTKTISGFNIGITSKQCALIAVDEILNLDLHDVGDYKNFEGVPSEWYISYWNEVKNEIEKL